MGRSVELLESGMVMVRALRSAHFWYTGRQRSLVGGILLSMILFINGIVAEEKPPVPIIFDTDIGNDVDDALALGMIHALQSRSECNLLAVTITKDHEQAAAFTDAVNTFYGRGEIPIGVCRSGVTPEAGRFNGLSKQKNGARNRQISKFVIFGVFFPPLFLYSCVA